MTGLCWEEEGEAEVVVKLDAGAHRRRPGTMIRIFPDFSVQVTASAGGGPGVGGGGGGGGMVTGPPVGRVPVQVPGATNGNPQSVQGINAYQQRYVGSCRKNDL